MAFDLANTIARTRYRIQDTASRNPILAPPDLQSNIQSALYEFSKDMPAYRVIDFAGSGAQWYILSTVIPLFEEGFSYIRWVNYPAAPFTLLEDPEFLDDDDFEVLEYPVTVGPNIVRTLALHFKVHTPTAAETVRVAYSTRHQLKDLDAATATTISLGFEEPFYDLCASLALESMAISLQKNSDPTLSADGIDYGRLVREYKDSADRFRSKYNDSLSVAVDSGPQGADVWLDWDARTTFGERFLFHNFRRGRWPA